MDGATDWRDRILRAADAGRQGASRRQAVNEFAWLAWILPLPSLPGSIWPVDPGLFPTHQTTFQPRVESEASSWWIGGLVLTALVLLVRWHAQHKLPRRALDFVFVVCVLLVFAAMVFLPSLPTRRSLLSRLRDPEDSSLLPHRLR
jgi:hypothetical protein